MHRLIIIVCLIFSAAAHVGAQQQMNFTQYMHNMAIINPGYIGRHEAISVSAFSRWQWAGVEGAPTSQALIFHAPTTVDNMSLGFQFIRDAIGVTNNTFAMAGGSYEIQTGKGYLSMGLQLGLQIFSNNLQDAYVLPNSQDDFAESFTRILPAVGYGFYYYTHDFYVGVSSPLTLKNKIDVFGSTQFTQRKHYFGAVGAFLRVSREAQIKPNILVRAVDGVPLSIDYNVNFMYKDVLQAGATYRPPEAVSLLLEVKVMPTVWFGYAYDYVIEPTFHNVTASTHEILVHYRAKVFIDKFH